MKKGGEFMFEGWSSGRYEHSNDNANKFFGRLLYIQDVNWFFAKIGIGLLIVAIYYLVKSGDLNFDGLRDLIRLAK